jgi:hypothetical protein
VTLHLSSVRLMRDQQDHSAVGVRISTAQHKALCCEPAQDRGVLRAQGYYLRALKMMNVPKEMAEEHYVDLASKPFYPGLVNYIVRCRA